MQRWRNTANNGLGGSVVIDRFLQTDADGFLDPSIVVTQEEAAKMRRVSSWRIMDDGTEAAAPAKKAEPKKKAAPAKKAEPKKKAAPKKGKTAAKAKE